MLLEMLSRTTVLGYKKVKMVLPTKKSQVCKSRCVSWKQSWHVSVNQWLPEANLRWLWSVLHRRHSQEQQICSGEGDLNCQQQIGEKIQRMAGSPPGRLGAAEKKRAVPALPVATIADTGFAELEKEATDGLNVMGPALDGVDLDAMDPMQRMLFAQLQQNALLLQKLQTPKASPDMMSLLAGGGGSDQGSSSSGAKGCLAREVFLRNVQDLPKVAVITRFHAMKELGISADKEDGSLMKKYIERRVPLANHRLLAHVAQLTAEGWAIAHESANEEMLGFLSRMMYFVEQVALDNGKIDLAWLLTGFTEPNSHLHFPLAKVPGLKPFCRLTHPLWISANLAYLKDLDFLEGRVATLGKPKPRAVVTEDDPDPNKPPKPKPKKKAKGGGKDGGDDPANANK